MLNELGRFDEALIAIDRAIMLYAGDANFYANRCESLYGLDRLDDALASIDQAIELSPDNADFHNNRGSTLANLDRLDEALVAYEHALELDPGNELARNNREVVQRLIEERDRGDSPEERPDQASGTTSDGSV